MYSSTLPLHCSSFFFFFNDTATTEIYTLSLHDALPIYILLSGGEAVVADFGIARAITQAGGGGLTETGIPVGTPAYMSPEQASGGGALDGRSDVYSLACVLHEMLPGEPPYTRPSAHVVIAKRFTD